VENERFSKSPDIAYQGRISRTPAIFEQRDNSALFDRRARFVFDGTSNLQYSSDLRAPTAGRRRSDPSHQPGMGIPAAAGRPIGAAAARGSSGAHQVVVVLAPSSTRLPA
jgi:hypothetical protein